VIACDKASGRAENTDFLCGKEFFQDRQHLPPGIITLDKTLGFRGGIQKAYLGVCGALPKNRINLQFIANLYLANSQRSLVNRNFCMNMQKFTIRHPYAVCKVKIA
jgi:hypothetical protein